jgi:hypothetical protein
MLLTESRFNWPSGFRGEDLKKSANQKQELPVAAMSVNGSGQNVQSLERTFFRCFLPSVSSFDWGVSEKKIKMWKVNRRRTSDDGRRTPSDGKSLHFLWQGELKRTNIARNHGWFCSWIFINQIASFMTSANKRWTLFGRGWWKLVSIFLNDISSQFWSHK